tara:strand:+ start:2971 stop:3540 length:570 start_codon:yes stop_codon:yes gene_type:complete
MNKGKCIIFSAPSGSGKTTLVKHLLTKDELNLKFSVSFTTRQARDSEKDGVDYHFVSEKEFLENIENENFLEFEQVYNQIYYGTLKSIVKKKLEKHNVIFDVDVEGGTKLKEYFKESSLSVFVKTPRLDVLEKRLRDRNKDSEKSISERLNKAKKEIVKQDQFDRILINDDLNKSKERVFQIVKEFLIK